jgi:Signal transduction histidine kinase
MNRKYLGSVLFFCFLVAAFFLGFIYFLNSAYSAEKIKSDLGSGLVSLNRAVQLSDQLKRDPENPSYGKALKEELSSVNIAQAVNSLNYQNLLSKTDLFIILSAILCIAFILFFYFYLHRKILRPFEKLEGFAVNVAAGNLDIPLKVERGNAFGAFSWAFDLMRVELKNAKCSEAEALQAKKTLVATISHDIKTPVASIRAYAEALSGGMAATAERRERYLAMIVKKSDEVAKLTDDLFLHAVSDLEKLSIDRSSYNARTLIADILDPFVAEYGGLIKETNAVPDVAIDTDARRLSQVFENILSNAAKYAEGSEIRLSYARMDGFLICAFEDSGGGIPAEDLPFITDKFYRGKNAKAKKGSGLGLYIVNYIMDKTGGFVTIENTGKGLLIKIGIRLSDETQSVSAI